MIAILIVLIVFMGMSARTYTVRPLAGWNGAILHRDDEKQAQSNGAHMSAWNMSMPWHCSILR